jgi:hypothetical protein
MRLYHPHFRKPSLFLLIPITIFLLAGCVSPQATQSLVTVELTADGETLNLQIPAGSTVQQALDAAHLELDALDRTEPPIYTVLRQGASVHLVRVKEEFEIEEVPIPFERQTLRNESLPVEQEVLIQKGQNGLKEITYRQVYEDGAPISDTPVAVKEVIVKDPVPEIRMIGVQAPLAPVTIPGQLIYLRDGNVWIIESTTGNRRAVLTSGDLDGRIFNLSSDGAWLLFTRSSDEEGQINTLWAARISEAATTEATPQAEQTAEIGEMIDLNVANVVHFADWVPGSNTKIVFSTVEPRAAAPGWQANNDLNALTFSTTGWTTKWSIILEANSGGVYGWWGTNFAWSPDGKSLAFSRPDSVGLLDYNDGTLTTLLDIVPLLTRGDWAWVPGLTWGPNGNVVYTVNHAAPPGSVSPEESQLFDLTAIPLEAGPSLPLVSQTGMFAYPLASPLVVQDTGDVDYRIAYLQAVFPVQSENSRYRLSVMDRDGSNRQALFPPEENPGLEPQLNWGAWSPEPMPESGNFDLAVLYEGNLWLVDALSGEATQITGDGLTTRVIWR